MEAPLFFDAHTHSRTQQSGECRILSIDAGHDLTLPGANRFYTAGLHPWYLSEKTEAAWMKLLQLAAESNCLGIGECGLDKLRGNQQLQAYWFRRQICLARELNKPLVLHVVRAHDEAISILRSENFQGAVYVHGFRGKESIAGLWMKMGAYLGISPAALKNPAPAFIKNIDKEKILCESDDSDLPLETIFASTASWLNISEEVWKIQAMKNAKLFYHV
ncbi:MAG: hypothetical protein RLZZ46_789 [Bacteroidota bacterium]|jgi:TatD DNase family protein